MEFAVAESHADNPEAGRRRYQDTLRGVAELITEAFGSYQIPQGNGTTVSSIHGTTIQFTEGDRDWGT
eukprot:9294880-Alexandrium_andersonii.AAC.1